VSLEFRKNIKLCYIQQKRNRTLNAHQFAKIDICYFFVVLLVLYLVVPFKPIFLSSNKKKVLTDFLPNCCLKSKPTMLLMKWRQQTKRRACQHEMGVTVTNTIVYWLILRINIVISGLE